MCVCVALQTLSKRKYLCLDDFTEPYYDVKCGGGLPKAGDSWYTICGTPFENRIEYIVVVWAFCLLGLGVMFQCLGNSGKQPRGFKQPWESSSQKQGKQKRQ